uniref:Ferritin n=1 Tax=Latimeria chalumnae TaxID=7897 RepID=H3A4J5_LATCH
VVCGFCSALCVRMSSQICQNYHQDCEAGVTRIINQELHAYYVYLSLSSYFTRDEIALENMAEFFHKQSHEKWEQAEDFMKFQNQRGGNLFFQDIKKPDQDEWGNAIKAMEFVLQLEKTLNQDLLDLHKVAKEKTDPHLCDFLETNFLDKEVKLIKKLGDHMTSLRRVDAGESGLGEYLFERLSLRGDK